MKHAYIKEDEVKGQYVNRLVKGSGYEVSWGTKNTHNKQKERTALQYMLGLEQVGGNQFRHLALSAERKKSHVKTSPS